MTKIATLLTKSSIIIFVGALLVALLLTRLNHSNTQARLQQITKENNRNLNQIRSLQIHDFVKDSIEGFVISPSWLGSIRTIAGISVNVDSIISTPKHSVTLLLIFSSYSCDACISQELDLFERVAIPLKETDHKILYISPDSLYDIADPVYWKRAW